MEDKATEEDEDRAADEGMIDRKEEQRRAVDHDDGVTSTPTGEALKGIAK